MELHCISLVIMVLLSCHSIHEAPSSGFGDIANFLIENGAIVDTPDYFSFTPLFYAVYREHMTIIGTIPV